VDDELALRRQVCFALYAASRSVINLYRPALDELRITYPQYLVLLVLGERGPLPVKDLGAALRLDSGTLSPLLKRMEAMGAVTRRRRADDERSVLVELTPEGLALRERARDVPGRVARATGIPIAELAELRETLTRLTAALDAAAYVSTAD
jgi:MarR family transcriptional regulator, organic hydroperoxide resistance regulator